MANRGEGMDDEHREAHHNQDIDQIDNPNQYVHKHWASWDIYGIAFSSQKSEPFRLAVGSLLDTEQNFVYSL